MADRELLPPCKSAKCLWAAGKTVGKSLEDLVSLLKNRLKFILYDING